MQHKVLKNGRASRLPFRSMLVKETALNYRLYVMLLPLLVYYLVFHLYPMWGAQIAFRNFNFNKGITGSLWVGLLNFREFFQSTFFSRLLTNTVLLSVYNIIFGFPVPILLALMLNEVRSKRFKFIVQTSSYLPHFISLIVACSLITSLFARDGVFTYILSFFGLPVQNYMINANAYRSIYTFSTIWQQYAANRQSQNTEAINTDPIAMLIVSFMDNKASWEGLVSDLLYELRMLAPQYSINVHLRSFPSQPNQLSRRLRSITSNLEAVGIAYTNGGHSRSGTIVCLRNTNMDFHASQASQRHQPNVSNASDGDEQTSGENLPSPLSSPEEARQFNAFDADDASDDAHPQP